MGSAKPVKVALDTNMVLAVEQFKVDIFEGIDTLVGKAEFVVPIQVKREIEMLSEKKVAGLALGLLEEKKIGIESVEADNADKALEMMAQSGHIVATNDRELRKKIKSFGGKIIYLRKKKTLEMG